MGDLFGLEAVLSGEMEGLGVEARLAAWWAEESGEPVVSRSGSNTAA